MESTMKTFEQFLNEDFNSPGAIQFLMPVGLANFKTGAVNENMIFYEHVGISGMNLSRYCKSFLSPTVAKLMQSKSTDFRFLIYTSNNWIDVFAFDGTILHQTMAKSLDANKDMKKYPSNIKYQYLYNESQMFVEGDTVGPAWCLPLIIWEGSIVSNLMPEALAILNKAKDVKTTFQIADAQWSQLINKSEYKL